MNTYEIIFFILSLLAVVVLQNKIDKLLKENEELKSRGTLAQQIVAALKETE